MPNKLDNMKTLNDAFKTQLIDEPNIVTIDSLEKLKNKKYYNGDEIRIGDKLLFGLLEEEVSLLRLISLTERQFDQYEVSKHDSLVNSTSLPRILKK